MRRNRREDDKAARDIRVFEAFAEYAVDRGLRVRPGSVENRRPREPDILCHFDGEGAVAFELVELVDSDLREEESVAIRKNRAAGAVWTADTTMERIRRKLLDKTYVTPHPMELLAWANPMITPPSEWMPKYEPEIRALRGASRFRRIWVANLGGPDDERGVWFVEPPLGE
jgi:hypothetical protein